MILRELFAKLGLDIDAQSFARGALAVEVVKFGLGKLVAAATDAVMKFGEMVQSTAETADQIEGLAQQAGISTDSLQRLGKAGAVEGMGLEDMAHSLVLLSRNMAGAAKGGEEQGKAFSRLGVHVKDAHGKLRGADDVFADLAEKFQQLPDGAEKTALSMQLFGRSGAGMIEVLNNGREGIEQFRDAQVMTPEQIAAGKEMILVQRQLAEQTKSLWRSAVAPLLPAITALLKQWQAWKKANAEVMKQRIQAVLGGAIAVVKALGTTLAVVIRALKLFADNWQFVVAVVLVGLAAWASANGFLTASFLRLQATAVLAALKSAAAWALAAAPFVAIGAAVAALLLIFDDLRVYQRGGKSLFGLWESTLEKWMEPRATDPWWLSAIKQFVKFVGTAIDDLVRLKKLLTGDDERSLAEKAASVARIAIKTSLLPLGPLAIPLGNRIDQAFGDQRAVQAPFVGPPHMPMLYPPSAPSGRGASQFTMERGAVQINVPPGTPPDQLGKFLTGSLDEWWNSKMEVAGAATGQ